MAKKPSKLTPSQARLEAKIFSLLQKKRYKEVKTALKELNKNSAGRKVLRAVFGSALWLTRSKALWAVALGTAGFKYGPEVWDKFTNPETTEDQMDEYISDLGENIPDRNFVTETPEGDILQARILSEEEVEEARLDLQAAAAEEEAAQREEQLFTPEIQRARATARAEAQQMRPTGTFARGQAEPTWGMLDRRLGDDYTPSAGGTSSLINQLTDAQRQELREEGGQYPPFSPGQPFEYTQERKFWPDLRVGPRPQPVQTPWEQQPWNEDVSQAEIYGPDNRQAALASLQAQQRLGEEVIDEELPPLLQRPSPHEGLQPIIAQPSAPPTGPEETMEGQRVPWTGPTRIPDLPTAEQAMEGDLDFEAITPEVQKIAETDEIDDTSEVGFWSAAARALGETLKEAAPTKEDWGLAGTIAQGISGLAGKITSGGDVTDEETKLATDIILDARGNILSTGEVAPEGDVSTTSASAKEGLKEQGRREVVQTNVDATVNKYNLSPNIGQTLSQIERNAGILRAASVMMGVKDISSNYRDMSIGQLRLARDIVEDLNGGQGPWKTWWSPDGKQKENLPIKGAASEPRPGWVDTNPVARLTPTAQLVTNVKDLIKTEGPWSAYNAALSFGIAEGFQGSQRDQHAADLVTMWMKEINPDLPWNFKWPTRPAYNAWANETTSDEEFKGLFGFNFQRLKSQ